MGNICDISNPKPYQILPITALYIAELELRNHQLFPSMIAPGIKCNRMRTVDILIPNNDPSSIIMWQWVDTATEM